MPKFKTLKLQFNSATIALILGVFILAAFQVPDVLADRYQEQIDKLNSQNEKKHNEQGILSIEASSISEAIDKLQNQIEASQARINELDQQVIDLREQIKKAEEELAKQKSALGSIIKTIYVEGDISTLEMLATSKDLSDFFDKQQYRESVRSKVKNTLDAITQLKLDLNTKKDKIQISLEEQKSLRSQLNVQSSEKNRILSLNQQERDALEGQIKKNSAKIADLRQQRADAEAALALSLSNGSFKLSPSGSVKAGDVVGAIGSTGLSSGPHLHLEVRNSSGTINPSPYIKSLPVNMPPGWISQGFGVSNPLYHSGHHSGIDYATSSGSPIFAIDGGNMYRGCSNQMLGTSNNAYGYVAIVEHSNGLFSVYAHMSGGPSSCNYNTYY